jgi:predicted RNA-binding Zn ribbon-like protein
VRDRRSSSSQLVSATAFVWVGNHPGLDFVNTAPVIEGRRVELLPNLESLVTWCDAAGVLRDGLAARLDPLTERAAAHVVRWSHELRAALRSLLDPPVQPSQARRARHDYAELNRVLADLTGSPAVTGQPWPRLELLTERPAEQLRLDLTQAVAGALTQLDATRIRRCANPECVLVFHDTSKGGKRRWCDMALCGNRAKATAHYRRRRRHAH